MKKITALIMALVLSLSLSSALVEGDLVLATVNGKEITKSRADELLPLMVDYQMAEGVEDYDAAINYLIQQELIKEKVAEFKFDQFTDEEKAAFLAEAQQEWDNAINEYVNYNLTEDTDAARAEAKQKGNDFYTSRGFSVEIIQQNLMSRAANDKLYNYLLGGYAPTDDEIQASFDQIGALYKEKYESDIGSYEYETIYMGQNSWYTPEGYRGVLHILLSVEPAIMDAYTSSQAALEENKGEDGEEAATVEGEQATDESVEQARQAVLDSKKTELEDIYARLVKGESFVSLVEEYGEDPGMKVPENLLKGYQVHANSVVYDPAFTKGAFSEKMQKIGDVSDPVISSFGIHIIYYLRDWESGLIMTDDIFDEIRQQLISQKESELVTQALTSWQESAEIVRNEENITLAKEETLKRLEEEAKEETTSETGN